MRTEMESTNMELSREMKHGYAEFPERKLDEFLNGLCSHQEPGAAVLVAKDGVPLFRRAYGMAHLELGVPATPDMVFRIGSITKQFTAVAILMLAEEGRLDLADPLTRFLPEYPSHSHEITIEHLLTHTSGIRNYTEMPEWIPLKRKDLSVTEMIGLFASEPLRFTPGTRPEYSNSGYHLLGAVIEAASGQNYEQFLRDRIFAPLKLQRTFYDMPQKLIPGRAPGYHKSEAGYSNADYLSMTHPYSGGALASTVDDLSVWTFALAEGRVLRPDTLRQAWSRAHTSNGESFPYVFKDGHDGATEAILTGRGGVTEIGRRIRQETESRVLE